MRWKSCRKYCPIVILACTSIILYILPIPDQVLILMHSITTYERSWTTHYATLHYTTLHYSLLHYTVLNCMIVMFGTHFTTLFIRYGIANSNILHCNSTMDCILSLLSLYGASTLCTYGMDSTRPTQYCVRFLLGTYAVRDSSVWVVRNLTVIFGRDGFLNWRKKRTKTIK